MEFMAMMSPFAPLLSLRVWPHALTLVMGALLSPGKRTVSQILRVMGLANEPHRTYAKEKAREGFASCCRRKSERG